MLCHCFLLQDIFDENGALIGKLRCQMFYEPLDSDVESCENSQENSVATSDTVATAQLFDRVATTQIADTIPMSENKEMVSTKDVPMSR